MSRSQKYKMISANLYIEQVEKLRQIKGAQAFIRQAIDIALAKYEADVKKAVTDNAITHIW